MRPVTVTPDTFANASALGAEEFGELMHVVLPIPPAVIAIAVSGGPDSMALAYCLQRWGKASLIAFIVDHGLRAESAQEAQKTQQNLAKISIEAEILRWEHPGVITRLHDSARKARYRLMAEACGRHGIKHLLLAHQRDDQAETILMRFAKGSGIAGLAGMAPVKEMGGVRLVRPLLQLPKMRLIATCEAASISYATDPSNASQNFARGRLRRVMSLLSTEGLSIERLLDFSARANEAQQALEHYTDALLRVGAKTDAAGVIELNLEQLRAAPRAVAQRAFSRCLQAVHTETYAPELASLNNVLTALLADKDMGARTLNGCLIAKTTVHAVVMRELAYVTDRMTIQAGECVVWDQRWRINMPAAIGPGTWVIKPLGNPPHDILDRLAPGLRDLVSRGRARATLPSLWSKDKLELIPSLQAPNTPAYAVLLNRLFNPATSA